MEAGLNVERNQKVFRELMTAMSRPGQMCGAGVMGEDPLMDVLNVLLDHETGFCVIGGNKQQIETRIISETGSKPEDISKADFIILADGKTGNELFKAKKGLPEYPDQGATVIYYIAGSDKDKKSVKYEFKGPGVAPGSGPVDPWIAEDEIKKLAEINSGFPLGLDAVIVTEKDGLMCMPRSLKITGRK
jgi:phosphonate C-P lyase system protein PhnH